jgi:hypothetical protein
MTRMAQKQKGTMIMRLGKTGSLLLQVAIAGAALKLMILGAQAQNADALTGRWGLAAYFRESDAARVTSAAAAACSVPYTITKGPSGGVMLHRPDETRPSEHLIKSGWGGKSYLSPAGESGDSKDREIMSFDDNRLVLRWLDASVAGRYGTMVFVRCRK